MPVHEVRRPMHVCLICIELFGYGSHGGFGRATRMIGRKLIERGHRVTVVTRRRRWAPEKRDDFMLDGLRVRVYSARRPLSSLAIYRDCQADIYHSQDASLGTLLAMSAMPAAGHVVTFRAPLDRQDRAIDGRHAETGLRGRLMHYLQVDNPLVRRAVRRTPWRYAAAPAVAEKAVRCFGLPAPPGLLATPIDIPTTVAKDPRPTVCFVGRWQKIKQPEHFLVLARQFPEVRFIAVGGGTDGIDDATLRRRYEGIPNLEMTGVLDQFSSTRLSEILSSSWILVNASLREGLPTTFLEAAAHRCAILSYLDPDGFASRFGHHAADGDLAAGLRRLLRGDDWRRCGEAAHAHVRSLYATDVAIDRHLAVYRDVLAARR